MHNPNKGGVGGTVRGNLSVNIIQVVGKKGYSTKETGSTYNYMMRMLMDLSIRLTVMN